MKYFLHQQLSFLTRVGFNYVIGNTLVLILQEVMLGQNNGTAFGHTQLGLLCCPEAWGSQKHRDFYSFFPLGAPALSLWRSSCRYQLRYWGWGNLASLNWVPLFFLQHTGVQGLGCLEKEGAYWDKESTNAETLREVMLKKKRKSRLWGCRMQWTGAAPVASAGQRTYVSHLVKYSSDPILQIRKPRPRGVMSHNRKGIIANAYSTTAAGRGVLVMG